MNKQELYRKIIERAEKLNILNNCNDRMDTFMDIESADLYFNMRLEEWLSANDFDFIHDFCGIQKNVIREDFPTTEFNSFVPRFAGKFDE